MKIKAYKNLHVFLEMIADCEKIKKFEMFNFSEVHLTNESLK